MYLEWKSWNQKYFCKGHCKPDEVDPNNSDNEDYFEFKERLTLFDGHLNQKIILEAQNIIIKRLDKIEEYLRDRTKVDFEP